MRESHFRSSAAAILAPALLLVTGCAGYHLGPVVPKYMEGVHTVAVPNFHNKTLQPRLESLAADTLIKQLQQDGTFRVASSRDADVIIEGTVAQIRRLGSRSLRSDVVRQTQYQLSVSLDFTVTRRSSGEKIDSGTIIGNTNFFVSGNDINQDEEEAIPLALEDASVHLVSHLSEGW